MFGILATFTIGALTGGAVYRKNPEQVNLKIDKIVELYKDKKKALKAKLRRALDD